ncbi:ribonuclease M5 [Listeria fleischmannii subsp. fleischmannii]|uniref:Ribonuclease M5 n=1 Tax=Listeria fleischmannii subsp. fleischmannii TaxID=1671902 RepID=A0A2X3JAL8_9LIST|nr:ribonuclease M5 [Listeria fleischmannii subsp. fleischmannii]
MEKPIIQEIIVVEGRDDTTALNRAVIADTIETGGSAINQKILEEIKHAKEKRGVIIFTDPDFPGEKLERPLRHMFRAVNTRLLSVKMRYRKVGGDLALSMRV